MATSLDPSAFDWTNPVSVREFAARCEGWAVSHRRRGALADLAQARTYNEWAAGARWLAEDMERKAA